MYYVYILYLLRRNHFPFTRAMCTLINYNNIVGRREQTRFFFFINISKYYNTFLRPPP